MTEVATEDRGRITIPRAVRDRLGERYRLVELQDGIKLLTIPDDPVESLRGAASDELKDASFDELREAAIEEGREQASEHVH